MRKLTLAIFTSILAVGVAHATTGTPCNGFEVKIQNNTADDLIANKIELVGGDIQPSGIEKLNSHSELVFTVNNTKDKAKMKGVLEFHSVSLPSKKAYVEYTLKNKHIVCEHDNQVSSGDYKVTKTRLPGHVTYTIG